MSERLLNPKAPTLDSLLEKPWHRDAFIDASHRLANLGYCEWERQRPYYFVHPALRRNIRHERRGSDRQPEQPGKCTATVAPGRPRALRRIAREKPGRRPARSRIPHLSQGRRHPPYLRDRRRLFRRQRRGGRVDGIVAGYCRANGIGIAEPYQQQSSSCSSASAPTSAAPASGWRWSSESSRTTAARSGSNPAARASAAIAPVWGRRHRGKTTVPRFLPGPDSTSECIFDCQISLNTHDGGK